MKRLPLLIVLIGMALLSFSFKTKSPGPKKRPSITAISKTLAFPVGSKKSFVGSFWGAVRDGGRRKHEGIDIFARKGTPVVAISDGVIVSGGSTPRGGKVLWLKSSRHSWSAYYAHLDKQLVKSGQFVRKGQVIGTVGNTGNARTTPSHLHFGLYTAKGAMNPYPYVKHSPKLVAKSVVKKKAPVRSKTIAKSTRSRR
jgi:murein DD-endopeptidase MepM/ murein hydrolase activator NlpD